MNYLAPRPKTFPRRSYFSPSYMHNVQIDLIDLKANGSGYIMNCIDVFSRRAESILIKSKSKEEIRKGLEYMFKTFGQKPTSIQSDKEKGLYALKDELQKQGITLYSVANAYDYGYSAPIVERFNRSMREYMNLVLSAHPRFNMRTLVR